MVEPDPSDPPSSTPAAHSGDVDARPAAAAVPVTRGFPRESVPKRFAIVIALLMATVSIISAVVANRAAFWSATAGDLGGQALQERLETEQIEDDLRSSVDADARLLSRYDAAYERTSLLRTQAADVRAADADTASALDLEAQGEFGVDVALWRFFQTLFPTFDADGQLLFDPEGLLAALRAGDVRLAELGRSDAGRLAAEARDRTTTLVAVAAVFVASLFVLTVAEVTSGRRRLVALVAGVGLAVGATILAAATDLGSGAVIVGTALLSLAVIVTVTAGPAIVRRLRGRRTSIAPGAAPEPGSADDAHDADAHDADANDDRAHDADANDDRAHDADAHDADANDDRAHDADTGPVRGEPSTRFAGTIGVLLAGATLLGAIVGYLQGGASDAGDRAAGQARDQALQALTEHQRTNQWATTQVEQWTQVLEQRARAVAGRQAAAYWDAHGDPARAALGTAEAEQRAGLADRAARLTELSADHPDGPDRDPDFPLRFQASQGEPTARRVILQDLANEANAHFGSVSAGHVAVLATVAIAAYLLGLSLVLDDRRSQRLFGVVGTGLLVVSAGWAVWNEFGAPATPDAEEREAIASTYAQASVVASTARTQAEWRDAVARYRAALELHPTLARARVGLANALFMAASPQSGGGFTSVSSLEAVRDAAAELEAARDLGWETVNTLGDGGFYETLLALDQPDGDHAAKAVELTAAALERAPDLPVVRFNHGAALLVAGHIDEARAAYQQGIDVSLGTDADGDPVFTTAQRWRVAAGALTDLELIAASLGDDPVIGPAIPEMRTLIVAGLGDPVGNVDAATQPVMSELEVLANSSQIWWLARIDDFDSERDVMSVVWSYEDPTIRGRHVLDTHSGPVRLGTVTDAGSFFIDGEAPRYWQGRSYLLGSTPRRCVPDGTYQVEVYINGRLAAEPAVAEIDQQELVTVDRRDMGLLFCRPADWVPTGQEDGTRAMFRSPDESMSLTVIRAFRPDTTADDGSAQSLAVMAELMADWPGAPQALSTEPSPSYFMGLNEPYVQWYDTATSRVKVVAAVDSLGTVFAAVVEGPADWVDGDVSTGITGSFSTQ